jgi:hypothetical protein
MSVEWFYTKSGSGERSGPVPEEELKALLADGRLAADDMVWREGMPGWEPVDACGELSGIVRAVPVDVVSADEIRGMGGWMTFVGVMTILYGVWMLLSCVGIINGILGIVAGSALCSAKPMLERASRSPDALPFLKKMKTFFVMTGVGFILYLVIMLVSILLFSTVFVGAFATFLQQMQQVQP